MTWKPTVCIYHGGCIDGFTAAWAVWRRWGDDVRYIPMGYGDKLPPLDPADDVLMVDFSLKRDAMMALVGLVRSVVVLDHHKTAEAELDFLVVHPGSALYMSPESVGAWVAASPATHFGVAFFDLNKSGARLAWEFCHGVDDVPPLGVLMVEDRDLWRFSVPLIGYRDGEATRNLHAFLASRDQTFVVWTNALSEHDPYDRDSLHGSVEIGSYLREAHDKNVQAMLVNAHRRIIGGHSVMAVNVPFFMASDTGHELLKMYPDTPFAATFYMRGDGVVQYSLRSEDSRVDVSEVARKFGGGGHRNAAGFTVPA